METVQPSDKPTFTRREAFEGVCDRESPPRETTEGFRDTQQQNQGKYEDSGKLKYEYQRNSYCPEGSP